MAISSVYDTSTVSSTLSPAARSARPLSVPSTTTSAISRDLGLGRAVRQRDVGIDAVLLEEAPRELGILGLHAHAGGQILHRLPLRVARDREHDPERPRGRLRVVQLRERDDVDAGLLDPIAAGDPEVEQTVGDVARDLLRAQDRDVDDAGIVDAAR